MSSDRDRPICLIFIIDQSPAMQVPFPDEFAGTMLDGVIHAANKLTGAANANRAWRDGEALIDVIGYPEDHPDLLGKLFCLGDLRLSHPPSDRQADSPGRAFFRAGRWIERFKRLHPHCRPPIVIHVSAGTPLDPAALESARRLLSLQCDAGPVLLYHVQLATERAAAKAFPKSDQELPDGLARDLFSISSVWSPRGRQSADSPRGMIFQANRSSMMRFLEQVLPFDTAGSSAPCPAPSIDEPELELAPLPEPASAPFDENVQFTTYCPREVRPETYATVLAFAHLEELRDDAAADELDPQEEVRRQAESVLGDAIDTYRTATQEAKLAVPRDGELTFVLEIDGFRCNPPRQTIYWEESVHRVEFRVKASAACEGKTCRGQLSVFLGDLLLAEAALRIGVTSRPSGGAPARGERLPVKRYRKIFASYSRRDLAIVQQFERYAAVLGDEFLRDLVHLRSGENWNEGLKRLIEEADVFQLFWSKSSMQSLFVRDEWMYALSLKRPNFIRPMYWEQPFPEAPPNLPPQELRDLHFKLLGRFVPAAVPAEDAPGASVWEDDPSDADPREADTQVGLPHVIPPAAAEVAEDDSISVLDGDTDLGLPSSSSGPDSVLGGKKPDVTVPSPPPAPVPSDPRSPVPSDGWFEETDLNIAYPGAPPQRGPERVSPDLPSDLRVTPPQGIPGMVGQAAPRQEPRTWVDLPCAQASVRRGWPAWIWGAVAAVVVGLLAAISWLLLRS